MSEQSNKEEYEEIGFESGSVGMFDTRLGGLLGGVRLPLGVTPSTEKSFNGDWGSLDVPQVNIHGEGTKKGICTNYNDDDNIFSISGILAESFMNTM